MAAAEIVGFAVAWVVVAGALAWSVLSRAGGSPASRSGSGVRGGALRRSRRSAAPIDLRTRPVPVAAAGGGDAWVTVEVLDGSGPEVLVRGELLMSAVLATRGFDSSALSAADVRVETATDIDGSQVTRFMVHTRVLSRPAAS